MPNIMKSKNFVSSASSTKATSETIVNSNSLGAPNETNDSTNWPLTECTCNKGNLQAQSDRNRPNSDVSYFQSKTANHSNNNPFCNSTFPTTCQPDNFNSNNFTIKNCTCNKQESDRRCQENRSSSCAQQFQSYPSSSHQSNNFMFNPTMPTISQPTSCNRNNKPIANVSCNGVNFSLQTDGNRPQSDAFQVQSQATFQPFNHMSFNFSNNPIPNPMLSYQNHNTGNLNIPTESCCQSGTANNSQAYSFTVNNYTQNYAPDSPAGGMLQSNIIINSQNMVSQMSINCVTRQGGRDVLLSVMGRVPSMNSTPCEQQNCENVLQSNNGERFGNVNEREPNESDGVHVIADEVRRVDCQSPQEEVDKQDNDGSTFDEDIVVLYESLRDESVERVNVSTNQNEKHDSNYNSTVNENRQDTNSCFQTSEMSQNKVVETSSKKTNALEKESKNLYEGAAQRKKRVTFGDVYEDSSTPVTKYKKRDLYETVDETRGEVSRDDRTNKRGAVACSNEGLAKRDERKETNDGGHDYATEVGVTKNVCAGTQTWSKPNHLMSAERCTETTENTIREKYEEEANELLEGNEDCDEDIPAGEHFVITSNGLPVFLGEGVGCEGKSFAGLKMVGSPDSVRDMWETLLITRVPHLQLTDLVRLLACHNYTGGFADRKRPQFVSAKDLEEILSNASQLGDEKGKMVGNNRTSPDDPSTGPGPEEEPKTANENQPVEQMDYVEMSSERVHSVCLSDASTMSPPPTPPKQTRRSRARTPDRRRKSKRGSIKAVGIECVPLTED